MSGDFTPTVSAIKHGYFVPQDITILGENAQWLVDGWPQWYHTDLAETRRQCAEWQKWPVDGLEFIPELYQPQDIPGVVEHAKVVRDHGIDVWLTPRLLKSFAAFPLVPPPFTGKQLSERGKIVTAVKLCSYRPDLDFFNPAAVDWLFESFHDLFLSQFPPECYQGYIWPEEHHGHSLVGRTMEATLTPWWQRPAYSDYCLEQWQQYCHTHDVRHGGRLVDRLPVADAAMVAEGKGKTGFYLGLNSTPAAASRQPVVNWPRNQGVWAAWDNFRAQTYTRNFLMRWSRKMHQLNAGNRTWRGVEYFGSSWWLLPYEKVTDPTWSWVHSDYSYLAWGYQCGIDLELLARAPEITHICHEFCGDVATARLEQRHDLFLSLIDDRARQNHGVLLHADLEDPRGHLREEEEIARWQFVKQYQPRFLSMWSVAMLHPKFSEQFGPRTPGTCPVSTEPWYQADRVDRFWRRLRAYQATRDPFAND